MDRARGKARGRARSHGRARADRARRCPRVAACGGRRDGGRCRRGCRRGPQVGAPGRRRADQGLARRRARARRGGAAVKSILIAVAVGMGVTLLGTPVAIRFFRQWGWGQQIREDGPHTHLTKMGTPTMGGLVIVVGILLAYAAGRFSLPRVTGAGIAVLVATTG